MARCPTVRIRFSVISTGRSDFFGGFDMSRMFASAARAMQSNTLDSRLPVSKPKPARISPDLPGGETTVNVTPDTAFLSLIDEARVLCGMSQKEMALSAGVNEGHFSLALRGTQGKNFDPRWLDKQPLAFRAALASLLSKKFGVSREQQRAIVLQKLFDCIEQLVALTVVSE